MMDAYNFLRKPASDFGWDWGPAFAPAGIHGGVQLITWDHPKLTGEPACLNPAHTWQLLLHLGRSV
jgi:hypothetical protein